MHRCRPLLEGRKFIVENVAVISGRSSSFEEEKHYGSFSSWRSKSMKRFFECLFQVQSIAQWIRNSSSFRVNEWSAKDTSKTSIESPVDLLFGLFAVRWRETIEQFSTVDISRIEDRWKVFNSTESWREKLGPDETCVIGQHPISIELQDNRTFQFNWSQSSSNEERPWERLQSMIVDSRESRSSSSIPENHDHHRRFQRITIIIVDSRESRSSSSMIVSWSFSTPFKSTFGALASRPVEADWKPNCTWRSALIKWKLFSNGTRALLFLLFLFTHERAGSLNDLSNPDLDHSRKVSMSLNFVSFVSFHQIYLHVFSLCLRVIGKFHCIC